MCLSTTNSNKGIYNFYLQQLLLPAKRDRFALQWRKSMKQTQGFSKDAFYFFSKVVPLCSSSYLPPSGRTNPGLVVTIHQTLLLTYGESNISHPPAFTKFYYLQGARPDAPGEMHSDYEPEGQSSIMGSSL